MQEKEKRFGGIYVLGKRIGAGAFGEVHMGNHISLNENRD